MPFKNKEEYNRYKRQYYHKKKVERDKRKRILAELKVLASQPLTITRASELVEKINQL